MTHQYMEIKIKELEKRIEALEQKKPETVTEFADRYQECGAKYGKLLEYYRQAVEASEVIKKSMECHMIKKVCDLAEDCEDCPLYVDKDTEYEAHKVLLLLLKEIQIADECLRAVEALEQKKAVKALLKQKWIPCSERLPEDGDYVLFCDIDGDIMLGYHKRGRSETHFSQDGTFLDIKNVKAWMPLPEPYKSESEEKE